METKTAVQDEQFYEDFEPFCQWNKEEGFDILEVHLPGFKRQDIRVQINNLGILNISGKQPRVEETTSALPSRFCKEIKISKNCTTNGIRAKFSGGILSITIPKKAQHSNASAGSHGADNAAWSSVNDYLVCLRSRVLRPRLSKKTAVVVILVMALGGYAVSRYPKSASSLNAFDLRELPSDQVP
ncbi:hypothetical protein C1H46_008293 [Malus baccata]|uniref:SHSP domain-containing protein n=1 Tax=Malus baccata TaxID=106549 RepID=A0A540N4V9_MALBA|nr:hypothetical protein C1H46_008293 [Malus baccata]